MPPRSIRMPAWSSLTVRAPGSTWTFRYPRSLTTSAHRALSESRPQAATHERSVLVVMLQSAAPVPEHLIEARDLGGTNQAEAQPLGVREVPDAFGQLRVLLFP